MPALPNTRHERFAQLRAFGVNGKPISIDEAYTKAGFKTNRHNAARLNTNEHIQLRIAELNEQAAARAGVTKERIMSELAKIGFADIRKAIVWRNNSVCIEEDPDTGEEKIVAHNEVVLVDSDKIDDATAAAISEISQTAQGGIKIKFHDKKGALVDMGKELGMFVEKSETTNVNVTVSGDVPSEDEWAEEYANGDGARPN